MTCKMPNEIWLTEVLIRKTEQHSDDVLMSYPNSLHNITGGGGKKSSLIHKKYF